MPNWNTLKRFCDKDGWQLIKNTDHFYYKKPTNNGSCLHVKVSRGSGEIRPKLWKRILSRDLKITQEYFNKIV